MKMYSRLFTAFLAILFVTAIGKAIEISGPQSGVLVAAEYVVVGDLSIVDVATSQAVFRGVQGRVKYAEAFVPQRLFLHI